MRFAVVAALLVLVTGCGRCGYEVAGSNLDSAGVDIGDGEDAGSDDTGEEDAGAGIDTEVADVDRPDITPIDVAPMVFRPVPSGNLAGDRSEDLVVTATRAPGALYVFGDLGAASSTSAATAVVTGTSSCAITGPGLLAEATGDEFTDILITIDCVATSTLTNPTRELAILPGRLAPGSSTIDDYPRRIVLDSARGRPQALAVADLTGGPQPDLIVLFPRADGGRGAAVIASDVITLSGAMLDTVVIEGESDDDGFGYNLESVPEDITGDGAIDLAINAASTNPGANTGAVYVFEAPIAAGVHNAGTLAYTKFLPDGVPLQRGAGIGIVDLDADASFDLIFASDGLTRGAQTRTGHVYVFAGPIPPGMVMRSEAQYNVGGAHAFDGVGSSLSVDGNVFRTGRHDLLVQACCATIANVERAGVVLGIYARPTLSPSFNTDVADFRVLGTVSRDQPGKVVVIGDVDDDGFDDFAFGDVGWNGGDGRVYIFLGERMFPMKDFDEADRILDVTTSSGLRFGYEILER